MFPPAAGYRVHVLHGAVKSESTTILANLTAKIAPRQTKWT